MIHYDDAELAVRFLEATAADSDHTVVNARRSLAIIVQCWAGDRLQAFSSAQRAEQIARGETP